MDSKERLVTNGDESSLVSEVNEKQYQDPNLLDMKANVHNKRVLAFEQGGYGVLKYQRRLYVPRMDGLQKRIIMEVHSCRYFINLGSSKMYRYLREIY